MLYRFLRRTVYRSAIWLICAFVFDSALFSETLKDPDSVLINGLYNFTMYNSKGHVVRTVSHPFEARLRKSKFLFITNDLSEEASEEILYSDGKETYNLSIGKTTDGRDIEIGHLNRGPIPKHSSSIGEILWLGLAPRAIQELGMPSNYSLFSKNGAELDPNKTFYERNADGFLIGARIWCTERLLNSDVAMRRAPPYDHGYQCGSFGTEGEFKINGRYVAPERFTLLTHTTKIGAKTAAESNLFARYEFTIKSAIEDPQSGELELVSRLGFTHMRDYRFSEKAALFYDVVNSDWKKADTIELDKSKISAMEAEAELRQKKNAGPIQVKTVAKDLAKPNRLILGGLIVCVLFFPPFLFFRNKAKNQK